VKHGYRLLDHTADLRLEIFGVDGGDLFVQAALALTDLITDPRSVRPLDRRTIAVTGTDWADLMVNWLRELLYLWSGEERLVGAVELAALEQTRLQAQVDVDRFDPRIHTIRNEIKAVTYHQIEAGPFQAGWRARVVFDI
jgi:SHS2 domain-containing protein